MHTLKVMPLRTMARWIGAPAEWLKGEADAGRVPSHKSDGVYVFDPVAVEEALQRLASNGREAVGNAR